VTKTKKVLDKILRRAPPELMYEFYYYNPWSSQYALLY
jgi:hypothetical protein